MDDETALRLFGTALPPTSFQHLKAGPIEVRLEDGNLRHIRFDGVEILRAISYVVRDRDWGTLSAQISELEVKASSSRFDISYKAHYENNGSTLIVTTEISGTDRGQVRYSATARAQRPFETNRCGFTVLHPITNMAGSPVTVEHCDGTQLETVFPDLIAPWQPFKSIRALSHSPAPHIKATCRFEGDEFEMEDQRNWSDASYKTYVRPLALPWPYELPINIDIPQSVSLQVDTDARYRPAISAFKQGNTPEPVQVSLMAMTDVPFPSIGLCVHPEEAENALRHLDRLTEIGPQSLLCHFDPTCSHGRDELTIFRRLQEKFPAKVDLEYTAHCSGDLSDEFNQLATLIKQTGLSLASLAVCPAVDRQSTPPGSDWPACPPLERLYDAAKQAFPDTPLGGGMQSYFTELNRKRPPLASLDFVTHATNPIVHAADDISVMETLETLPHITRSARAIMGQSMPYRIGPSTIAMRQNPYGSRTFSNPNNERVCMAHEDPRHRGLFGAAWILGYAAALGDERIEQWVPASFTGPRGLLAQNSADLLPIGQAVAALTRLSGRKRYHVTVSDTSKVAALGIEHADGPEILLINLTPEPIEVLCGQSVMLGAYQYVSYKPPHSCQ